jgi:predicted nucleotidyltransferase
MEKPLEQLITKFSRDTNVLGIMLFGSQARGMADRFSDTDIYILLSKRGAYTRLNYLSSGAPRFDIFFDPLNEVKQYLRDERHKVRRITSHMLAHGIVLFERGKELSKLQSIAKANLRLKTICSHEEILMHKYSIDDFWGEVQRDYRSGNNISFGINCQLLITNVTELVLKLRGGFFCPPREMNQLLHNLDPRFEKLAQEFYAATVAGKKVEVLRRIVRYAYTISGGPLPRRWCLRK